MKKAEALRVAIDIRETYLELRGHYEVTNTITLVYYRVPRLEDITEFTNYVLENEDKGLYDKTFGIMDFSFINKVLSRLHFCWFKFGEKERSNYINGNYDYLREIGKFEEINNLAITYNYWEKISEDNNVIRAVFENLTPQPDPSTPINPNMGYPTIKVTDLVTSTENPTGASPGAWRLPIELDTPEARKYITQAIERGFIKPTSTGLRWQAIRGIGGNSQLGYFLNKVYQQPRPITALETYFGVKKLSSYICNADYEVKRADVIRWRTEIDKLFNE